MSDGRRHSTCLPTGTNSSAVFALLRFVLMSHTYCCEVYNLEICFPLHSKYTEDCKQRALWFSTQTFPTSFSFFQSVTLLTATRQRNFIHVGPFCAYFHEIRKCSTALPADLVYRTTRYGLDGPGIEPR